MKSLMQSTLLCLFVYGSIEAISFGFFYLTSGTIFSQAHLSELLDSAKGAKIKNHTQQIGKLETVVHPYTGYVYEPESWNTTMSHDGLTVNSFGTVDDKSPVQKRATDKKIVGVFGGSVAWWFSKHGANALTQQLRTIPSFSDKKIVLVRAALGGYKQPQQLMSLSYLLSQGAEFDLVINLDGVNEVSVPVSSNLLKDVHPYFPQNWYFMTEKLPRNEIQSAIGQISYLTTTRKSRATWLEHSSLRFSPLLSTLWIFSDKNLSQEISLTRKNLEALQAESKNTGFATTGPPYKKHFPHAIPDLVRMWTQASIQMKKLSEANGAHYFHYLQPNQYLEGSKPLGKEERKIAFSENTYQKQTVPAGYPQLQAQRSILEGEGVHFVDLSLAFKDISEQLYIDNCCHLNEKGSAILGALVGADVAKTLKVEN